jgi:HK97 family phage major capsid protein
MRLVRKLKMQKFTWFFAAVSALAFIAVTIAFAGDAHAASATISTSGAALLPQMLIASAGIPAGFTDEVRASLDGMIDSIDAIKKRNSASLRDLTDRLNKVELRQNRPAPGGGGGGLPGASAAGDLAAEHKALGAFAKAGSDVEFKDLQVGDDPSGGYIVMPAVSTTMTQRIFDQSPIRRLARVITIENGDAWQEPLDKNDSGAEWVGEIQARNATTTPDLGMLTVPLCEIWAQQPITQRLLDTSYTNIGSWIEGKLADKFARVEGESLVNGDTPLEPRGFMSLEKSALGDLASRPVNALQFVNSGAATEVTADGLRDLYWTLRAAHRANSTWLMASATANAIDKLKSGDGSYLWRDSSASGVPPTLLGRPVEFDENMPTIGAGTYPVAFGDWKSGYVIVDRLGLRFVRDPYSSKPHVLFDAFKRVGGAVANTDAIKLLKIAAS